MCDLSGIMFAAKYLTIKEIKEKRVIEVGSCNVNGSIRPIIESWEPQEYIGVDIDEGPGVDLICPAEELVQRFGENSFDVVVSTEMVEHVRDWRNVTSNLKRICKKGGIIFVTTRSFGFPYHAYPHDYWRYEVEDMKEIFDDCHIVKIESDPEAPGVFIKVKIPADFEEKNLENIRLYNIVKGQRTLQIHEDDFRSRHFIVMSISVRLKARLKKMIFGMYGIFIKLAK